MELKSNNLSKISNESASISAPLPSLEIVDYAEMTLLGILLITGVPLNAVSFIRSLGGPLKPSTTAANNVTSKTIRQQIKAASRTIRRSSALEFHLTVANLLVICLYGFSQICWLATYSWKAGDLLCRIVKFCDTFCFYATSNIVVVIAIDRVYVSSHVDRPLGTRRNRTQQHRLFYNSTFTTTLAVAWILAFVCSIPQLLVWRVFVPYLDEFPDFAQCVTIWQARSREIDNLEILLYDRQMERIYTSLHLLFVFWAPFVIIVFSYILIIVRFREKILLNVRDTRLQQRAVNAILFKKRATSFHQKCPRLSYTPAVAIGVHEQATLSESDLHQKRESRIEEDGNSTVGRLSAVPIVINFSQTFICQPMVASAAVRTLTRAQRRAIKTAFWIVVAYVVCWSPYNALVLWRYLDQSFESRFLEFSSNFIVLNAVLNPLIYKMR